MMRMPDGMRRRRSPRAQQRGIRHFFHRRLILESLEPRLVLRGDFNGDGVVNAEDIQALFGAIDTGNTSAEFDLDDSDAVNQDDVRFLVEDIIGTFMGDANLDGRVDALDLNQVGINWRRTEGVRWSDGDFTGNFAVDAIDLNLLALNWRKVVPESEPPVITVSLTNDTARGAITNDDRITADPSMAGSVSDESEIGTFRASLDDKSFVDVSALLDPDGTFAFGIVELEQINSAPLVDGRHTLSIEAADTHGNQSTVSHSFVFDTTPPIVNVSEPMSGETVTRSTRLVASVDGTGSAAELLTYRFDDLAEVPVAVDQAEEVDRQLFLSGVVDGPHELTVRSIDAAGNESEIVIPIRVERNNVPFAIASHTPLDGANEVGVTFRPQIFFSKPVDPATLNATNFFATAAGKAHPATVVPAGDGSFAWLFFDQPLPGASRIELHVDGESILAADDGSPLDADGDGTPGGMRNVSFTTVSLAPILGTSLSGVVVDPGPDNLPMTVDDFDPGPDAIPHTEDDVFFLPIAGVEVFLLGLEENVVTTDATGRFVFDAVPVGNVKVAMEGMTATSPPPGSYFPEMVMDANMVAGIDNWVMAGMSAIYLPRIDQRVLKDVDSTSTTLIVADEISAPDLPPDQREFLTIEVRHGSLIAPDGQPMEQGQIGISTVPPELVRDMLPPGVLQHTFDITVQAPGISNFSTPAPMTFPNVFDAAPGTKLNFLSFDHTTGRLVIEGTSTVSADGLSVTTDPGTGITHPGWHGLAPPGSRNDPPCNPKAEHTISVDPIAVTYGLQDYLFVNDDGTFTLSFGNAAPRLDPSKDACHPNNVKATPLVVQFQVDSDAALARDFFLSAHLLPAIRWPVTFELLPGQQKNIQVDMHTLLNSPFDLDESGRRRSDAGTFFGVKINISAHKIDAPDVELIRPAEREIFVYRLLDLADDDRTDGIVDFVNTVTDGRGKGYNDLAFDVRMPPVAIPQFNVSGSNFERAFGSFDVGIRFDPTSAGQKEESLTLISPAGREVGTIKLRGTAVPPQIVKFSKAQFLRSLQQIVDNPDARYQRFTNLFANGFNQKASELYSNIVAHAREIFARLDPRTAGALNINDTDAGPGIRVFADAQLVLGGSNFCGSTYTACSTWTDVSRSAFVDQFIPDRLASKTSYAQDKLRLASILNRSFDDNMLRVRGIRLNPDDTAIWLQNQLAALEADPEDPRFFDYQSAYEHVMSRTLAHEIGHLVGAIHVRTSRADLGVMGALGTQAFSGESSFTDKLGPIVKMGLGLPVSFFEFETSWEYYEQFIPSELPPFNDSPLTSSSGGNGSNLSTDDDSLIRLDAPVLAVFDRKPGDAMEEPKAIHELVFDPDVADGQGRSFQTRTLYLFNEGNQPLQISNIELGQGSPFYLVSPPELPLTLEVVDRKDPQFELATLPFDVRFDPDVPGPADGVLRITSDSLGGEQIEFRLSGQAKSPFGDIVVDVLSNNLGGVAISGAPTAIGGFATIKNIGAGNLTITNIRDVAAGQYSVGGLPTDFPTNPLLLGPAETFAFDVSFDPVLTGLQPGEIEVVSNDPDTPVFNLPVVGTGLFDDSPGMLDYGNDYVAMETPSVERAPVLRDISDTEGNFSFFLPAEESIHYVIFDPASGLVSHGFDVTAPSGQPTQLTAPFFQASIEPDRDGDGLPADIEFAIGTSDNFVDSDGDGISDFDALIVGVDPLGGRGLPTGMVSAVQLEGEARQVIVEGVLDDPQMQLAFVATGDFGLGIVDVSDPLEPVVLSQVDLEGDNSDVALDQEQNLLLVAGGVTGLHLVNVSDPMAPGLIETIDLGANATGVGVFGGVAYVAGGDTLISFDLDSRQELGAQRLGASITDLERRGETLFALTGNTLHAVAIDAGGMNVLDSINVPFGGDGIGLSENLVLVAAADRLLGGISTVDISDPTNLALISGPDNVDPFSLSKADVAGNGSGLALLAGGAATIAMGGGPEIPVLDVLSLADPGDTQAFITRIDLPETPRAVSVGAGLAFVANGAAGLSIVNFEPPDFEGVPPTVGIELKNNDVDSQLPGTQIRDGTVLTVFATAEDDVQVRDVELLLNGQVVARDVSFPFDLMTSAPTFDPSEDNAVTLQARSTDSGGNSSLSNAIDIEIVRDTSGPSILQFFPDAGSLIPAGPLVVDILFDEPLAPGTVNAQTFRLLDDSSSVITAASIQLTAGDRRVQLSYDNLTAGDFEFVIDASNVTNVDGSPVGDTLIVNTFSTVEGTIFWTNLAGGDWNEPGNWDLGRLPTTDDVVVLSVPGDVVITVPFGSAGTLLSDEQLLLQDFLFLNGPAQLNQGFVAQVRGSLQGTSTVTLHGTSRIENNRLLIGGTNVDLINKGTFELANSTGLSYHVSGSGSFVNEGTVIHSSGSMGTLTNDIRNLSGANWEMRGGSWYQSPDTVQFVNEGTFRYTNAGEAGFLTKFSNQNGVIEIDSGLLRLGGGGENTGGLFSIADGATLAYQSDFGGPRYVFATGTSTYQGAGILEVGFFVVEEGARVIFDMQGNSLELRGRIDGSGEIANAGHGKWINGFLGEDTELINTGVLDIVESGLSAQKGVLINRGTVNHTASRFRFESPGAITNEAEGTYIVSAGADIGEPTSTAFLGNFNNRGIVRHVGEGTSIFNANLNNQGGTIDVQQGMLNLRQHGLHTDGSRFIVAADATLSFTGLSTSPGSSVRTQTFSGTHTGDIPGTMILIGANLAVPENETATLNFTGNGLQWDLRDWDFPGTLNNEGVIRIDGNTNLNTSGRSEKRFIDGVINNFGTIVIGDNIAFSFQDATLNNRPPGLIDVRGNANFRGNDTSRFNNEGTLVRSSGDGDFGIYTEFTTGLGETEGPVFTNSGTVDLRAGTFRSDVDYIQTEGETVLNGADMRFAAARVGRPDGAVLDIQGGVVRGTGTIGANVTNASVIEVGSPDATGILSISENYTQTAEGVLKIDIGGRAASQFDRFAVSRRATLDGSLEVTLVDSFVPAVGDQFQVVTFGFRTGEFSSIVTTNLPPSLGFNPSYFPALTLETVAVEAANAAHQRRPRAPLVKTAVLPDRDWIMPRTSTESRLVQVIADELDFERYAISEMALHTSRHRNLRRDNFPTLPTQRGRHEPKQPAEEVQERLLDLALRWW